MTAKNRGKCNKNKGDITDMINMNNGNTLNTVFRKLPSKHFGIFAEIYQVMLLKIEWITNDFF